MKEEYLRLAQFCYIDTDLDFKSQELVKTILDPLWSLVRFCTQEISKVTVYTTVYSLGQSILEQNVFI